MCGRYTQLLSWSDLVFLYGLTGQPALNLPPRYNIAPTQDAPVVRSRGEQGERELVLMRWGLVPSWAKDVRIGTRMINARAETVAEKPAFRRAFRQRRCLVVADGFYEWAATGDGRKQPYRVTVADGRPFAFAGLWERWRAPTGEVIESFTIIVTAANETLRLLHDRMPVMLNPADFDPWLDHGTPLDRLQGLCRPYTDDLVIRPAGLRVNSVRNDDPGCLVADDLLTSGEQRIP